MTRTDIIARLRAMANYYAAGSVGRNTCAAAADLLAASAMSAGTAKTPKAVEGEARQLGPAKQETPK